MGMNLYYSFKIHDVKAERTKRELENLQPQLEILKPFLLVIDRTKITKFIEFLNTNIEIYKLMPLTTTEYILFSNIQ